MLPLSDKLFDTWPEWMQRPFGVIVRIAGALGALTFGGFLAFWGYFGATFKQTPPVWDVQDIALVVAGVVVALSGLSWAIRPSRLTMAVAVGAVFATLVMGGLLGGLTGS